MASKRRKMRKPEQIVARLRDGDAMLNAGKDLAAVLQALEISAASAAGSAQRLGSSRRSVSTPAEKCSAQRGLEVSALGWRVSLCTRSTAAASRVASKPVPLRRGLATTGPGEAFERTGGAEGGGTSVCDQADSVSTLPGNLLRRTFCNSILLPALSTSMPTSLPSAS